MAARVTRLAAPVAPAEVPAVDPVAAEADRPTVTPASGGAGAPLVFGHFDDVAAIGYETAEFFLSGNAHAYTTAVPLSPDGRWDAIAADPIPAAYTTRVVVHTPIHAAGPHAPLDLPRGGDSPGPSTGPGSLPTRAPVSTYPLGLPDIRRFPVLFQAGARYRWNGEETCGMIERSSMRDRTSGC